jgi:hypothetical protein
LRRRKPNSVAEYLATEQQLKEDSLNHGSPDKLGVLRITQSQNRFQPKSFSLTTQRHHDRPRCAERAPPLPPPTVRLQPLFRAEVGQTSASKDAADIRKQLSVTAIMYTRGKDNIGQPQGDIRESPLSQGCRSANHTYAQSLPRDMLAVQAPI